MPDRARKPDLTPPQSQDLRIVQQIEYCDNWFTIRDVMTPVSRHSPNQYNPNSPLAPPRSYALALLSSAASRQLTPPAEHIAPLHELFLSYHRGQPRRPARTFHRRKSRFHRVESPPTRAAVPKLQPDVSFRIAIVGFGHAITRVSSLWSKSNKPQHTVSLHSQISKRSS